MTDTRVALAPDRLPWLQDVPERRHVASARRLWIWVAAIVLLVAGASYWLGLQRGTGEQRPPAPAPHQQTVTTPLPEPQLLPPEQRVEMPPAPIVEPSPAPGVRSTPAPVVRPSPDRTEAAPAEEATGKTVATEKSGNAPDSASGTEKAATAEPDSSAVPRLASASELKLWPSRVIAGAHGRVVQIGAFGSVHQAKVGWVRMARAYPGVKRLPAVVVEARNSKGRKFYRFQIGTTSQAHSEVLCQRMQTIDFSCAVVGLPWKPKGVER